MSREAGPAEEVLLGLIRICNDINPRAWGLPIGYTEPKRMMLAVVNKAIAEAAAAERERCAAVAEAVAGSPKETEHQTPPGRWVACGHEIARRIRGLT